MPIRFRFVVLSLALLAVAPLHAALGLHPHAPTTADAITLRSEQPCGNGASVTRDGNVITATVHPTNCNPPFRAATQIALGKLPAGSYRAVVTTYTDVPPETLDFIVRDSDPMVRLRPSVILTNAANAELVLEASQGFAICENEFFVSCESTTIEVGGVAVQPIPFRGKTVFVAPTLAAGWKDLRLTTARGVFVFPNAVYYHAAGSEPDVHAFERILFPVLFSTGGAGGSNWRSEAVISNPTMFPILTANHVQAGGDDLLPARSRESFSGEGFPHGVALLVPRAEAESVAFALRVRDVSRDRDSFGTEIPVVRENAMSRQPGSGPITGLGQNGRDRNNDIALLAVPRDQRYRTKVRIYGFRTDPIGDDQRSPLLRIVGTGERAGNVLETIPFMLEPSCNAAGCAATPEYAEIDLAAAPGDPVDLFIQFPGSYLGWAFASVTNNNTQQVTTITPSGKGGRPCTQDC